MGMQDIWKLKKNIAFGQGLFTLTKMAKQHGDFYIGSKRSKSDYLSVFWTVCCLANFVCSLFNGKMVQMVSMGVLVPTPFH